MKRHKKYVIAALSGIALLFLFMTWYKYTYSMDLATTYEINSPSLENRLLIATQGIRFKNAITHGIVNRYKNDSVFIRVIDISDLAQINPNEFDVILTDNMFGDILSDQGSSICGSKGLLPSASIGNEHAMFEPFHGSYPQAEGKNIANPVASILSTAMMLSHFGLHEESRSVVTAVDKSMRKQIVTQDLNVSSKYGTNEVGDFIAANIIDSEDNYNYNYENIGLGKSTII